MKPTRTERDKSRNAGDSRNRLLPLAVGAAAILAVGALALTLNRHRNEARRPDSAPGRTAKGLPKQNGLAVVGRTVTINKPRSELYAFWRDFRNLPTFMENVTDVRRDESSGHLVWTIRAPLDRTVEIVTEVTEDRENECIAWRSVPESQIETEGRVVFRDAPGGRGTQVEAVIAYKPPGGELGHWIAKTFQREPNIQGRRELKRFRMLMETGEVATSSNQKREAA